MMDNKKTISPFFSIKTDITFPAYEAAQKYLLKKLYTSYKIFVAAGFIFFFIAIFTFIISYGEEGFPVNAVFSACSGVALVIIGFFGNNKLKKSVCCAYDKFAKNYGSSYEVLFFEDHLTITNPIQTSDYEYHIFQKAIELPEIFLLFLGEGKLAAALIFSKSNVSTEEYDRIKTQIKDCLKDKPYIDMTSKKKAKKS